MKSISLSKPINICGRRIKNRIVVPPMSDFGTVAPDGLVHQSHIDRYEAYAKGGAGLIIIEASSVLRMPENRDTLCLENDDCIPGIKSIADIIHHYSVVTLVQIMLTGLETMEENKISEISRDDFLRYKEAFISAAIRCQKAGFDGIELHCAHGMYLDEVLEESTRSDEYGGCFENRIRLLKELITEIKKNCGKNFIIAVRFGNSDYEELINAAITIEKAGADILDVSSGIARYSNIPNNFLYDSKIYAASLVKNHVHIPVICVGNIFTGNIGESIIDNEYADMIAVGRGHLSDPAWANKTLAGVPVNQCLQCKNCLWWIDGNLCAARRKEKQKNGISS